PTRRVLLSLRSSLAHCILVVILFSSLRSSHSFSFFFFNDTATTEIYTLSLHDALPISSPSLTMASPGTSRRSTGAPPAPTSWARDRKSTRLNSSHVKISYAVFCLKKKKKKKIKSMKHKK